ncbi:MAG: hypothetical protein O2970_12030 [Proteobacteria bacterium]|nr:hypothetical protein [Pseudomonadota bacterium]
MTAASSEQSILLKLHLFLERNNNAKVQDAAYECVENDVFTQFDENYKNLGNREYTLTAYYKDDDNLDEQMEELLESIENKVEHRDCNIATTYICVASDKSRRWE